MMDPLTKLVAAIAATGMIAIAGALDQPSASTGVPTTDRPQLPAEYEIVTGQISDADLANSSFSITHADREEPMRVSFNDQTRFNYNGESSDKATVLQVGSQVAVRHIDQTALLVSYRNAEASK